MYLIYKSTEPLFDKSVFDRKFTWPSRVLFNWRLFRYVPPFSSLLCNLLILFFRCIKEEEESLCFPVPNPSSESQPTLVVSECLSSWTKCSATQVSQCPVSRAWAAPVVCMVTQCLTCDVSETWRHVDGWTGCISIVTVGNTAVSLWSENSVVCWKCVLLCCLSATQNRAKIVQVGCCTTWRFCIWNLITLWFTQEIPGSEPRGLFVLGQGVWLSCTEYWEIPAGS